MAHELGPLMIDVEGVQLTEADIDLIKKPVVGGLILFTRNYQSLAQLESLVASIREIKPNIIIAVDHEGGRVQRFREGFTRLPPMRELGQLYIDDKEAALLRAEDIGYLIAQELIAFDIDLSFAPVLDIDYGVSAVIGDRSFSDDVQVINKLSSAFIKGMHNGGMATTGKHFPGHGAVEADSHLEIPIDNRAFNKIAHSDLEVFKNAIEAGLDSVMPAHVIYDQFDDLPAGFSKKWLLDVLREQLKFDGVIFSDDLTMEGASVAGSYPDRADAALKARCDMVLVCNNRKGAEEVACHLTDLVERNIMTNHNPRLERMRYRQDKKSSIDQVKSSEIWKRLNVS